MHRLDRRVGLAVAAAANRGRCRCARHYGLERSQVQARHRVVAAYVARVDLVLPRLRKLEAPQLRAHKDRVDRVAQIRGVVVARAQVLHALPRHKAGRIGEGLARNHDDEAVLGHAAHALQAPVQRVLVAQERQLLLALPVQLVATGRRALTTHGHVQRLDRPHDQRAVLEVIGLDALDDVGACEAHGMHMEVEQLRLEPAQGAVAQHLRRHEAGQGAARVALSLGALDPDVAARAQHGLDDQAAVAAQRLHGLLDPPDAQHHVVLRRRVDAEPDRVVPRERRPRDLLGDLRESCRAARGRKLRDRRRPCDVVVEVCVWSLPG
eukprot:Unigene13864_Nuclearia_a/m.41890 Unigene13864_Nuclearia_a/g.41890  ORF Unigene13864_Nuclearia_a/g.41890 Unigene13864_Nuclearia_a/m.41890 type:complete len:323 (-) Unigene13864_Nuclearia_a:776-1744(-)